MKQNDYGKFIRQHRLESGYRTQRELAEKTGISESAISRMEANKNRPSPENIEALAKALPTTSVTELMVICGYWNKNTWQESRVEFISKDRGDVINEAPSTYAKELLNKIELSDEELIKQFGITVDGVELSEKEVRKILAIVRIDRQHEGRDQE